MFRKLCTICIIVLTLSGCVKYIDLPVWVCPVPGIPAVQELKTDSVLPNTTTEEILKALVWDLVYLKGRTQSLELILEGYKRPPEDLSKLLPNK